MFRRTEKFFKVVLFPVALVAFLVLFSMFFIIPVLAVAAYAAVVGLFMKKEKVDPNGGQNVV